MACPEVVLERLERTMELIWFLLSHTREGEREGGGRGGGPKNEERIKQVIKRRKQEKPLKAFLDQKPGQNSAQEGL